MRQRDAIAEHVYLIAFAAGVLTAAAIHTVAAALRQLTGRTS